MCVGRICVTTCNGHTLAHTHTHTHTRGCYHIRRTWACTVLRHTASLWCVGVLRRLTQDLAVVLWAPTTACWCGPPWLAFVDALAPLTYVNGCFSPRLLQSSLGNRPHLAASVQCTVFGVRVYVGTKKSVAFI